MSESAASTDRPYVSTAGTAGYLGPDAIAARRAMLPARLIARCESGFFRRLLTLDPWSHRGR